MTQFQEVRNRFMAATNVCKYPLTYDEWLILRDDLKVAALYVQFFDEISLAWFKAKSDFVAEEDGISTLMQYLIKNVPRIVADRKKFTAAYIYSVAYNCMGCLRRVRREQDRYEYTVSQYVVMNGVEQDILSEFTGDGVDVADAVFSREIWNLIEDMDEDTKSIIDHLLNRTRLSARLSKKKSDIIKALQTRFAKFHDTHTRFSTVLQMDDLVSSAVVEMEDGSRAVYYGETVVDPNGITKVIFFGDTQDYIIPMDTAQNLIVLDVELY